MILNLMFTLMIMTMMTIMITHPLSLGMILLIQTMMISLIMGFFNYNYWYSYLLFLIMIGGMLVLFAYMTSIASNEKFTFSLKMSIFLFMMLLIMLTSMIILDQYLTNINNLFQEPLLMTMNFKMSLNKFINWPSNLIMILMIIYLLITLIAIVKITNIKKGPLRQLN